MATLKNKPIKTTSSEFLYRIVEFFLLFLMLAFGAYALYKNTLFLFYIITGVIGYICFITEHKRKIIINKIDNKFLIVEKSLFNNYYKILKNINLDMIECAYVHEFNKTNYHSSSKNRGPEVVTMYKFDLKYKNEDNNELIEWAYSEKERVEKKVEQVNNALQNDESYIEIEEKPYLLRLLIGIPSLVLYFTFCVLCIWF